MPEAIEVKAGLEGVVVSSTALSFIDGNAGTLLYRGININELAEKSNFEEICYLLWHGRLPNRPEWQRTREEMGQSRALPMAVVDHLRRIGGAATPMAALRTGVSLLAVFDPEAEDNSPEANLRKAMRLTGQMATLVAAFDRIRNGKEPIAPDPALDHACDFLRMLSGRTPDEVSTRAMDIVLVLHADHGFNASTFAARVTASTLSDIYSAITTAIGTLKGPLHGGANEAVMKMLLEIGSTEKVSDYLHQTLAAKKRVMGFGHRVYKTFDPRAEHLRKVSRQLGKGNGNMKWYEMTSKIEEWMVKEKHLYPNVDLYSASCFYYMGIETDLYTPIFAVSRIAGWSAHVLEQLQNNRLIRPNAQYVGPFDVSYTPLEKR
ncbi:MAG TPA: citrate synthase [Candidatus Acidoferrales bacterium]